MKKIKRLTTIFLSLIMIFYCLPIGSFAKAESISNEAVAETPTEAVEEWHIIDEQEIITDEMIGAVSEITSLREENVKHFRLSDGTYEAVVYSQPVHRKDKNNVWKDIDNTIELTTDVNVSKYSTQDSRVTFADRSTNNADLFTLSENGYSVSMKLLSAENEFNNELGTTDLGVLSTPTVNNSSVQRRPNTFSSIDEAKDIDNSSSIMYNNIRENTSIEYVLTGNDVKENIIINAPCESYEYVFEITLDGLCAYLNDKGEILLNDRETQETKYVIPAPYMYDANGICSYDVFYTLAQVKDGIYLLEVNADEEWINSEDRAFPVVVDPSIKTTYLVYDTYTDSANPTAKHGDSAELWVSNTRTAYIKLDLPELPSGATISTAYLYVPYYYNISTGKLSAGAYRVLSDWSESSLDYNTSPTLGSRISVATLSASTSITQSSPGNARFTMTNAVNEWYNGTPNYGIAIKREQSTTATNQSVILKSWEANAELAYITINYTYYVPDGVYALQLSSHYAEWMTVEDDICWSGVNIQHEYSTSSPTSSSVFDRSRLFKITRVGTTARYTVRSMLNNNISFNIVNNKIVTKEIPSVDIEVPYADTFLIEWQGDGFTITPNGSSYAISMSYSSDDLYPELKANASTWDLVQYTGTHREGIQLLSNVTQFVVDKTITLKPAVWSTESGYNMPLLLIPSIYSSAASIVWDDDTRTGEASFFEVQQIRIDWRIQNEAGSDFYSGVIYCDILPIEEGVYYLKNVEENNYMQLKEGSLWEYTQSGKTMELSGYVGADYQKWEFIYFGDGYYQVYSYLSGKSLTASVSENSLPTQEMFEDLDTQLWKITKTTDDMYKFSPKSSISLYLASGDEQTVSNKVDVRLKSNGNLLWELIPWLSSVTLYGIDSINHDHISVANGWADDFSIHGWENITIRSGSVTSTICKNELQSTNIFTIRCHGTYQTFTSSDIPLYTGIILNDPEINNNYAIGLYSHEFSGINSDSTYLLENEDYSSLDIVAFIACSTAKGGAGKRNLVTEIVEKGAHSAIGFSESIVCADANAWTEIFYSQLLMGKTVQQAVDIACLDFPDENNLHSVVICGNPSIVLS